MKIKRKPMTTYFTVRTSAHRDRIRYEDGFHKAWFLHAPLMESPSQIG
jgi:hypothetical protein